MGSLFWTSQNCVVIRDERQNVRELWLRKKSSTLREFRLPKLNFDAGEYCDLIDWKDTTATEPPLIMNLTEADIRLFVSTHGYTTVEFDRYPCRSQSVAANQ